MRVLSTGAGCSRSQNNASVRSGVSLFLDKGGGSIEKREMKGRPEKEEKHRGYPGRRKSSSVCRNGVQPSMNKRIATPK